jgi:hypothetical protein
MGGAGQELTGRWKIAPVSYSATACAAARAPCATRSESSSDLFGERGKGASSPRRGHRHARDYHQGSHKSIETSRAKLGKRQRFLRERR